MEEAMAPMDILFLSPLFDCSIIAVIGLKTFVDPDVTKTGLQETMLQHPRFTSVVAKDDENPNNMSWRQTKVNLDNHVFVPNLDQDMNSPDLFVENYVSDLTRNHIDQSKPLWELHLLNVKTSEATSTIIFKFHHSLGDGPSLISLLLASSRKMSDPSAWPTIPKKTSQPISGSLFFTIWSTFMLILNTIVDTIVFMATIFFLKDTKTPLKGGHGVAENPKRLIHRAISLDDLKMVKKAMNVTINDVALGITQAALSRYLGRKLETEPLNEELNKRTNKSLSKIRLRAAVMFNLRPTTDIEIGGHMTRKVMSNTTIIFSNVVGPDEEISLFGYPVAYIAPSVYGHPQACTVHFQSYANKMTIVLAIDQSVIPDPHELCNDFVESFELIKAAALKY